MNNIKFHKFPASTQLSDYSFPWKVLIVNSVFMEKAKLQDEELQKIFLIFEKWHTDAIKIMQSDSPKEYKGVEIFKLTDAIVSKFSKPHYKTYFQILIMIVGCHDLSLKVEDIYKLIQANK